MYYSRRNVYSQNTYYLLKNLSDTDDIAERDVGRIKFLMDVCLTDLIDVHFCCSINDLVLLITSNNAGLSCSR